MFSKTLFRFDPALPQFFCTTDDDPGAGGGSGEGDNPPPKPKKDVNLAVESAFVGLIAEHGSPEAAAKHLIKRNHSLLTAKDKAELSLKNLQDATKDNVLSDAEKTELERYRAKGKPEDFDALKERADKADSLEREKVTGEAAELLKLDHKKHLFNRLLDGVEFEIQGEGDERKALVKTDKGPVSFEDYAKTRPELEEALPLLSDAANQSAPITPYGKSAPIGGGLKKTTWDRIREEKRAKPSETPAPSWQEQAGLRP
jgi:hypothetical protein